MKIMDIALSQSEKIWDECVKTVFLTEMMTDKLSQKKFLQYIVQDSIYLRDYLKTYAMAIFKSNTLAEMQMIYSALGFVNDSENVTRLKYLADNNMTDFDVEKIDKLPECLAYTTFLIDTAKSQESTAIIMAAMPCLIGYHIVFSKVKSLAPHLLNGYYGSLIGDYTSDSYAESCKYWAKIMNEKCANMTSENIDKMLGLFMKASDHELKFWEMAGRE